MSNKSQKSEHQKNIAEQFDGLDMETLIVGPLIAASDGQQKLAESSSEFIKDLSFPSLDYKK